MYKARNYALKKCNGEFIAFLDADDWWDKNFLSSRKSFFKSSNAYGFSYSNCYHYYEKSKKLKIFSKNKIPTGFILDKLLKFYFVKLSTIIIKNKIIKSYKFNPKYNIIGDYESIIRISEKYKPEIVYTHYEHDLNIDHYYTFFSTFVASRPSKDFKIKKLLSFEIPSSTDWGINSNGRLFAPNYFVDIKKYIKKKIILLNQYKFEMRQSPHSRSIKNINSLSIFRGGTVGLENAEAFVVNKIIT